MELRYSHTRHLFGLTNAYEARNTARIAGFTWDGKGAWTTPSPYTALTFAGYASPDAVAVLRPYLDAIADSRATTSIVPIPAPDGREYMPFQRAGVTYAAARPMCLIGDEPGLGKTIQAIGAANYLGLKRLLVICPAGLRLNWATELEKWHIGNPGVEIMFSSQDGPRAHRSLVTSYDLAKCVPPGKYDLVIADEGHYLKNPRAERTRQVLGRLLACAPRAIVLTGTPIPNRVNEIYPVLRRMAPAVIDHMSYQAFIRRYGVVVTTQYGEKIIGVRHEDELYARMRAGLMVRRSKAEVLADLPPKRYKMVVFPADGSFAAVLQRESEFSAKEIVARGAPVGSAMPEIRREMGIAKAPLVVRYVADMLEDGTPKAVVFAHHRDVVSTLERGLARYGAVVVTGATRARDRDGAVKRFQTDPACRVFIGNIVAAGVGVTLTAASEVVFAEASWVPGENEQAADRCHRIGQNDSVLIHYLVVEKSIDAAVLGAAARKRRDIGKLLDGKEE